MTDKEFKQLCDIKNHEMCIRKYNNLSNDKNVHKTFNDKIRWLTLYNCTEDKINCTDKIKCREYCKHVLGYDLYPKILNVYADPMRINLSKLPKEVMIKCNHGCGFNLYINQSNYYPKYKKTLQLWLLVDYSELHGEYHYHFINRKCFSEEYLGNSIIDYKFYCFHGEPKYIECMGNRDLRNKFVNSYDENFSPIYNITRDKSDYNCIKKPELFDDMLDISKKLSKAFKFVRIDFYYINDQIYLSEMTFSPSYGNIPFLNRDIDLKFGELLQL